ncbi:LLM class F420-dependent oxidoreductase [Pseudolysinimonas kribbensis]|uniref:LLM class F420-dependent oxidoreductase n=1 Tax=Pseudolysinimonas kribbensis TaxID=433641 RepID=A0ABQ6K3D9_9MICO|nr:LLM class F420-dependent oxidoreductase [Pseudolysinimonas kribbensis]GMA94844.1 LLM class F420-dependent oxidoreductase [Pseudolysinimonas kribbensis]
MTDWKASLGTFGVWESGRTFDPAIAPELERLGYPALWLGSQPGDLEVVEQILDATTRLVVATGIVSILTTQPRTLAESYQRVVEAHPGRLLLGIGVGHPERVPATQWRPYTALNEFLDGLDAGGVPVGERALAALGPRVLRLSAERSAGAHPYLVTPEHTREARGILGAGPLLAPEQRVVLRTDPAEARAIGRPSVVSPYLGLRNYRESLQRLGYTDDDLAGEGSDRLIDDLVVSGDPASIVAGLRRHLDAGADHVAVHVIPGPGDDPVESYAAIAQAAGLR